jgi:hypothetical protein
LQDILKPLNWGYWCNQTVSIKKGALFDHERCLFSVTAVFDDRIEAKALFSVGPTISFHKKNFVIAAIARKQGVDS